MNNTYASALQKLKELDFTTQEILDIFATIGRSALVKTFNEISNKPEGQKVTEAEVKNFMDGPNISKEFYLIYEKNLQKLIEDNLN